MITLDLSEGVEVIRRIGGWGRHPLGGVASAVRAVATPGPVCLSCGRRIPAGEAAIRIRGGSVVHRRCATYSIRRRATGADRLGYPRR